MEDDIGVEEIIHPHEPEFEVGQEADSASQSSNNKRKRDDDEDGLLDARPEKRPRVEMEVKKESEAMDTTVSLVDDAPVKVKEAICTNVMDDLRLEAAHNEAASKTLNSDQAQALDLAKKRQNVLILGPTYSGVTTALLHISHIMRTAFGKKTLYLTFSQADATMLHCPTPASLFRISESANRTLQLGEHALENEVLDGDNGPKNQTRIDYVQSLDVIVLDGLSHCTSIFFNAWHNLVHKIVTMSKTRKNAHFKPFGGIQIIAGGNFGGRGVSTNIDGLGVPFAVRWPTLFTAGAVKLTETIYSLSNDEKLNDDWLATTAHIRMAGHCSHASNMLKQTIVPKKSSFHPIKVYLKANDMRDENIRQIVNQSEVQCRTDDRQISVPMDSKVSYKDMELLDTHVVLPMMPFGSQPELGLQVGVPVIYVGSGLSKIAHGLQEFRMFYGTYGIVREFSIKTGNPIVEFHHFCQEKASDDPDYVAATCKIEVPPEEWLYTHDTDKATISRIRYPLILGYAVHISHVEQFGGLRLPLLHIPMRQDWKPGDLCSLFSHLSSAKNVQTLAPADQFDARDMSKLLSYFTLGELLQSNGKCEDLLC